MSRLAIKATANARTVKVLETISKWNAGLLSEDLEAKYARMAESPFVFYRGTNRLLLTAGTRTGDSVYWESLALVR